MFPHSDARTPVPALADIIGEFVPDLMLARSADLLVWLPTMADPPEGWIIGELKSDLAPTRIALHRNPSDTAWDGCEVINLFSCTGSIPHDAVEPNVACTLQALSADDIAVDPLALPSRPGLEVSAARAAGYFATGEHRVRGRYTAYLVQDADSYGGQKQHRRGALVECNTFVTVNANPSVHLELIQMERALAEALQLAILQQSPTS